METRCVISDQHPEDKDRDGPWHIGLFAFWPIDTAGCLRTFYHQIYLSWKNLWNWFQCMALPKILWFLFLGSRSWRSIWTSSFSS